MLKKNLKGGHTPSFPVENKKDDFGDGMRKHIEALARPIFEKALNETSSDRLSGGVPGINKVGSPRFCFYHPHNRRLYLDFNKDSFVTLPKQQPTTRNKRGSGVVSHGDFRIVNHRELCLDNFRGCRIVVKKTQVEVTNKVEPDRKYVIVMDSREHIREQVFKIVEKKVFECLEALRLLIETYGGGSEFKILNSTDEDKVFNEKYIDMIPIKQRFYNAIVKKAYKEPNVEFSNPVFTVNHLSNSALSDFSPEIANGLSDTSDALKSQQEAFKSFSDHVMKSVDNLARNMDTHVAVMQQIRDGLKGLNSAVGNLGLDKKPVEDDISFGNNKEIVTWRWIL